MPTLTTKSKKTSFSKWGHHTASTILVLAILSTNGCATFSPGLTSNNYKERIAVERQGYAYWTAKYVGPSRGCFPPLGNRICQRDDSDTPIYEKLKKLDMASYSLSFQFGRDGTGPKAREFMRLRAAELAIHQGYKILVPLEERTELSCSDKSTTKIDGQTVGSTFSAKGTTSNERLCAGHVSSQYLFLNDKEQLAQGVFYQVVSGPLASEHISPVLALYFGSTPGLNPPREIVDSAYTRIPAWEYKAWQKPLDAKEVISTKID